MPNSPDDRAIQAAGLGKRFGIRWVLRGVSFVIERGEAVALLGPNGSGKSTILRILGTLLRPNAGSASINGLDVRSVAAEVRHQVGYLAHTPGLYEDLTATENLRFAADMLGLPYATVPAVLERVGLVEVASSRVRGFSAGMQRRLALARLIMRQPRVLLLDEPYSNLDGSGIELMNSIIGDLLQSGGAALIALHELAPARAVLHRTLTLAEGRIRANHTGRAGREHSALVSL